VTSARASEDAHLHAFLQKLHLHGVRNFGPDLKLKSQ
jgi:hypothetical protein